MYLIWRNICIVPAAVSVSIIFVLLRYHRNAQGGKVNLYVSLSLIKNGQNCNEEAEFTAGRCVQTVVLDQYS